MSSLQPLILTARMDAAAQTHFNDLRQRYFPPARNFLSAHVTMFHALPPAKEARIFADLKAALLPGPLPAVVPALRFLGQGVAYEIDCPALCAVRRHLATIWAPDLTPQDRQGWRPHVTVQNKVPAITAKAAMAELQAGFTPFNFRFEGFDLWRYDGGPWLFLRAFDFK